MKLLKFTSTTCQPCKVLANTLTQFSENDLVKNMTEISSSALGAKELFSKFNVRTVPTLILINDFDEEIKRVQNVTRPVLEEFLNH